MTDIEYLKKEDIYNKLVDYNDFKTYESEEFTGAGNG